MLEIHGIYTIWYSDILWQNAGLFQKVMQCYVIIAVDFELCCLIGLPFLLKLTELKVLKWKHVVQNLWS